MIHPKESGMVFDIQHFSVSDGPGIRTTVFLKGCPLRCLWCHNPESYIPSPQIMLYQEKCRRCGACAAVCPEHGHTVNAQEHTLDRTHCIGCGACTSACLTGALETAGDRREADEVMAEVMEDEMFYLTSGGGMTLSGGEPMAQPGFALTLARRAKEKGLHVCMETCGHCSTEALEAIRPYIDIFLYDYKLTGDEAHRRYTGVSQELILRNLRHLNDSGASVVLRCPMIPGVNIHEEHAWGIVNTAKEFPCIREINLEPYHGIGLSKRERLGMPGEELADFHPPKKDDLQRMARWIEQECGVKTRVM